MRVLILCGILLLTGCKTLTLQEYTDSSWDKNTTGNPDRYLTEEEIRQKVVGNSIKGISPKNGQPYFEYYLPDGTIRVFWQGEIYQAKWAVSGSLWCVEYVGDPRSCYLFSLKGDRLNWYDPNGKYLETATLIQGNPEQMILKNSNISAGKSPDPLAGIVLVLH